MAYKETPLPRALEHDFWPYVLEVVNHPKVAHLVGMGKVYVALEDTSPKAMTKLFNAAKDATILGHSPDQLLAAGGLCLEAGDFLFSRDMHGPHDPMDDVLQAYSVPIDDLLGPKEDRTASPAVQQGDNTWTGGVQWERSDLTTPVTGSKRSYTLGTTHQIQCKASIKMGIKFLKWGTPDMALNLKHNAEVHNVQPIGCDDASGIVNYAFPTVQINISSTKKLDDDAWLTCMINHPDLEDGDQAGVFVLMELGFFVKQDSLALAVFSGLRWHVGSPPTSATPSPSSLEGTDRLGMAAGPDHELIRLTPEHINPEMAGIAATNHGNWAADGLSLTDPKAYFSWFVRAMVQQNFHMLNQLDPVLRPQLDLQKFLSAFSITIGDEAKFIASIARNANPEPEPTADAPVRTLGCPCAAAAKRAAAQLDGSFSRPVKVRKINAAEISTQQSMKAIHMTRSVAIAEHQSASG
ncbi:hypothetical protein POSPLADRAFT_1046272 [Postia placenta MAD-698-R-SB12]|uniref:Uncharacterized protein n=1 Tax=Postia placenta MAD-698-R-SB12 TaxID=670580 RepID=A0A1X6N2N3_9APHY|nr:hypothetical protein POSPLADRAFT_1046272 [Postia placenta MAD-698-R-SB12]OSX62887.1 hypothetical protein POSPLADRAFT_1046272 [Postia placenta MAD-698-R-SB12]